MKKIIAPFIFIFFAIVLLCSAHIKQWMYPDKEVQKNIDFTIVQTNAYSRAAYAHSSAMLSVMVISLHKQAMDTIMVKDFPDFKLRNLSSYSKGFHQSIHVPHVIDKKEQIIFLYTIRYKSKESILSIPSAHYIGKGSTSDSFMIRI